MSNSPKTVSLHGRPSLVTHEALGSAADPIPGLEHFLESLPDIYAGHDFRRLALRWAECAQDSNRKVGLAFGAHVVKVGVQAHLIDLMERGALDFLATHGAGAIHDIELALAGRTSEDVSAALEEGQFGMTGETVEVWKKALLRAQKDSLGLGHALGLAIVEGDFPHKHLSLLARAVELNRPLSILVAMGTDTIHVHPDMDGAALGESSLRDFHLLCDFVGTLQNGLWVNLGSAVILPEAFLKGVALAANSGVDLAGMMTAVLDMIRHYRPTQNVVNRPPGEGLYLIGQHELLVPLLHQAIRHYLANGVESHA